MFVVVFLTQKITVNFIKVIGDDDFFHIRGFHLRNLCFEEGY